MVKQMNCLLIPGFLRCEIEYAAKNEMVIKLEDFLRRRSMICLADATV